MADVVDLAGKQFDPGIVPLFIAELQGTPASASLAPDEDPMRPPRHSTTSRLNVRG